MDNINPLIEELSTRMMKDYKRMARWRHFHRSIGVVFTVILIAFPAVMAVGLVSSETTIGKIILLLITITGGIHATFKPYLHSHRRRMDMNAIRRLHDEFRGEVIKAQPDNDNLVKIYQKYSKIFSNIYELRGKELIDATLSITEQREIAGRQGRIVSNETDSDEEEMK